jgi:hypothetical protein
MFLDDAVSDTCGVDSGLTTVTATDAETGTSWSECKILGTNFSSLSILLAALGSTVAARVGVLAGSATDAVAGKLVITEMFLDGADSGPGGVAGVGSFELLVSCLLKYENSSSSRCGNRFSNRCIGRVWNVLRWHLLIRGIKINVFRWCRFI